MIWTTENKYREMRFTMFEKGKYSGQVEVMMIDKQTGRTARILLSRKQVEDLIKSLIEWLDIMASKQSRKKDNDIEDDIDLGGVV